MYSSKKKTWRAWYEVRVHLYGYQKLCPSLIHARISILICELVEKGIWMSVFKTGPFFKFGVWGDLLFGT